MSNVVVSYGNRRATIKTTPTKSLSEIRTEACTRLGLTPPSSFILRRGQNKLDLSLPMRLTGLSPGAKLDLVQSSSVAEPLSITLRTVDPVDQLTGSFQSSQTIWSILRKFENEAQAAGRTAVNITERYAPSAASGSGRLLYQMPAVRVANRELASFGELQKTLEELGCQGRTLLVLRYLPTELPYEEAIQKIGSFASEGEREGAVSNTDASTSAVESLKEGSEDVDMPDMPTSAPENTALAESELQSHADGIENSEGTVREQQQQYGVTVFQPPETTTIAAVGFEVPDSDYEIGINELKRIKENYHKEAQPKRLLSDKEIEEKEESARAQMESINYVKIRVRYPDSFTTDQTLDGKSTAQDLYTAVRSTLRYPNEKFTLLIPPRDAIKEDPKRLTVDLKIRSGLQLHLVWSKEAAAKAREEPALKEELIKASQKALKPVEPEPITDPKEPEVSPEKEKPKEKGKSKEKNIENKLKSFLNLKKK